MCSKDKVVFLDRDGTLNKEVNYLYKPKDLSILPGVLDGIKLLNEYGLKTVVITNQAGVARGYYSEEDVKNLHEYMNKLFLESGAHIDNFFYCPHHPEYGIGIYKKVCHCRKPDIGLFEMAEQFYNIDKTHSYMIGDKQIDIDAGHKYGVRSILVGTGYGEKQKEDSDYDFYSKDFMGAAEWIIKNEKD